MTTKLLAPRAIGERFNPWHEHCGIFPQDEVCRMAGLSCGAKLLYHVLVRFSGKDGRCFPSRERLAEELALTVRQIARLLSELKKAGLIEHERGKQGKSNRYYFLWHEAFNRAAQEAIRKQPRANSPQHKERRTVQPQYQGGVVPDDDIPF